MKRNTTFAAVAFTVLTLMAFPVVQLAAQRAEENKPRHQTYKLIDLGTFGGPQGFINPFGNGGPYISGRGTVVGQAETTVPAPPEDIGFVCYPGPNVNHAFEWQHGKLTDMGALSPSENNCSDAYGINARGGMAGVSTNGQIDPLLGTPEFRAVVWNNGRIINLGTFGGNESCAASINNSGQVAGFALNAVPDSYSIIGDLFFGSPNSTQTRAFLWENGKKRDLGTLGGPDAMIFSTGFMNDRGQVAGVSYTNSTPGPTGFPTLDPFLWNGAKMIDLGSLGGTFGFGYALNRRGQVVGSSDLEGDLVAHPFFWDRGVMTDIGTFGGSFGDAFSVNDGGEVVGGANLPDESRHAFLWKNGSLKDLGVLPGDQCSGAWSINSQGQVVGVSGVCHSEVHRAFLWEHGEMVDLKDLIFPRSDVILVEPNVVADNGEIGINGLPPGCNNINECGHAYLLIPNGECDDDCEGRITARQNNIAGSPQIAPRRNLAIRTTAPAGAIERLRAQIRKQLHPQGRSTMTSD
jgi:probable HAF family extracellular repeat protein